jgi:hypothetical protein
VRWTARPVTGLLVATRPESDHDVAQLQHAAADECFLVRLHGQPGTLVKRIITREPEGWRACSSSSLTPNNSPSACPPCEASTSS